MSIDSMAIAFSYYAKGDVVAADAACAVILRQNSQHFDALHLMGVLRLQAGLYQDAADFFASALVQNPTSAEAQRHLGLALRKLNTGPTLQGAVEAFAKTVELLPNFAAAWGDYAEALLTCCRYDEALMACDRALSLNPNNSALLEMRGGVWAALGRHDQAIVDYGEAIARNSMQASAYSNRGTSFSALGQHERAVEDHNAAVALQPSLAAGYSNRGVALFDLGQPLEAIKSYDEALLKDPALKGARVNRAIAYASLKLFDEALADYTACLDLDLHDHEAFANRFELRQRLCDWTSFDDDIEKITAFVEAGAPISPMLLSGVSDDPQLLLKAARRYSAMTEGARQKPLWSGKRYDHPKIRLAYVAGDFHDHPVAVLMADLIERHDRQRFDVIAVSHGSDDGGATRHRMKAAFDIFFDGRALTDRQIAQWICDQEIDIAVDLSGFTFHGRPNILAHRPAPCQAVYLGNPGTTGASYIDYMIADSFEVMPGAEAGYSEAIVRLPPSLFPTDPRRAIAAPVPTRHNIGLPEEGFVFCCFNSAAKILPMFLISGCGFYSLWREAFCG